MSTRPEFKPVSAADLDRRRAPRLSVHLPVQVSFPQEALAGTSADVSEVGVMFVTDQPLQVTVRIEEEGRTIERVGRVIRTQQLGAVSTAIAIEFEEEEDPIE